MKTDESKRKVFFYIDGTEEVERPFLCTPSPDFPQIIAGRLETTVCE